MRTAAARHARTSTLLRWSVVAATSLTLVVTGVLAAPAAGASPADDSARKLVRRMEYLDRGLVAVKVEPGVYLSWRFLGDESDGTAFRVYRDGVRVADVTDSTNYSDPEGQATSSYAVAPVVKGKAGRRSAELTPQAEQFYDIPLQQPAPSVVPRLETFPRTVSDKVTSRSTWSCSGPPGRRARTGQG